MHLLAVNRHVKHSSILCRANLATEHGLVAVVDHLVYLESVALDETFGADVTDERSLASVG